MPKTEQRPSQSIEVFDDEVTEREEKNGDKWNFINVSPAQGKHLETHLETDGL